MTVYADEVFFLNALLDWLLIRTASLLSDGAGRRSRAVLAATFGGLYAALAAVFPALDTLPLRLLAATALCLLAFGTGRTAIRQTALFFLVCCGYAGLSLLAAVVLRCPVQLQSGVPYYSLSLRFLLLLAALLYFGVWLTLQRLCRHLGELLQVRFTLQGRQAEVTALCDTGNTLKDPISAEPVMIADLSTAQRLLPQLSITKEDLQDPSDLLQRLRLLCPQTKPRLLPFRTVGESGLLLAVRCTEIRVGGRQTAQHMLAFSAAEFSETYQALTGGIYEFEQSKNRSSAIGTKAKRVCALYRRQRHSPTPAVSTGGAVTAAKNGAGR